MSRRPRTTPRNLRRGTGRISGGIVDKLNALGVASGLEGHENIGTELAREINQHLAKISVRQDAQAGFGGPVVVAPQPRQPGASPPPLGMSLSQGRLGDVAPALQGTDVPNLDQVRALFTCDAFGGHVSGFPGWFEDCVDQRKKPGVAAVAGTGILHAFWGYTYEIPNFTDTLDGDPGVSESDQGSYWQFIVPVATTVNRVSFLGSVGLPPLSALPVSFALYDLTVAADSAPLLATSDTIIANTITAGRHTLALDSRLELLPGMYGVAYIGPCFDIVCINGNPQVWAAINELWEPFHRYGIFSLDGGGFPSEINSGNILTGPPDPGSNYFPYTNPVPLTYWDDSEEFTA